jgi:broad specificity phosphatase PhoE
MPLTIKLVRHGESMANIGEESAHEIGDHNIQLSPKGHEQAKAIGAHLGKDWLQGALLYSSPYRRTRQTLSGILTGAGLEPSAMRILEDPRLREVEHGYDKYEAQTEMRQRHGWFYYRFDGGESPADCYDRTSSFLESMMRQVQRKNSERVLITTHGLTIRCFVMRFLHLSVEQFNELDNPTNCAVITLDDHDKLENPGWKVGRWGCVGLHKRQPGT